ncbi:MAG: rhomboid family intramembrane serine protease, partial [Isosphaeraceae bacterium]
MIPYATDAPIYHWPKATVALIVVNTLVFGFTIGLTDEQITPWLLTYGDGLHPLQWVSSLFLHAGLMHLIGNMIFLWSFGLVVEGKVGSLVFLAVYLGIGVAQSAVEQVLFLGLDGGASLGASGVIYGLLAMCLVWAPRNEFSCLVFWRFMPSVWEVPILWFALLYIGMEVLGVVRFGASPSGALAHLLGAVIGFPLAVLMLKGGLVNCENWDLFAVLQGRQGRSKAKASLMLAKKKAPRFGGWSSTKGKKRPEEAVTTSPQDRAADVLGRLQRLAAQGDADATLAAYRKARDLPAWSPSERDLMDLIKPLLVQRAWSAATPLMRDYIQRFPDQGDRMRLKLAQVLIRNQDRPTNALRVLAEIGALPAQLDALRLQLIRQA